MAIGSGFSGPCQVPCWPSSCGFSFPSPLSSFSLDPSMVVRNDIVGKYGNGLYVYEPGDIDVCEYIAFLCESKSTLLRQIKITKSQTGHPPPTPTHSIEMFTFGTPFQKSINQIKPRIWRNCVKLNSNIFFLLQWRTTWYKPRKLCTLSCNLISTRNGESTANKLRITNPQTITFHTWPKINKILRIPGLLPLLLSLICSSCFHSVNVWLVVCFVTNSFDDGSIKPL